MYIAILSDKADPIVSVQKNDLPICTIDEVQIASIDADMAALIIAKPLSSELSKNLYELNLAGMPILGIGQGALTLLSSGIVPGLKNYAVAALANTDAPFSGVRVTENFQLNPFTRCFKHFNNLITLYDQMYFAIPPGLDYEIRVQGLNCLAFCDERGDETPYMAALSNKVGNAFAILPDIECTPLFLQIIESLQDHFRKGHANQVSPLFYQPR
jgi:hypothetical protein